MLGITVLRDALGYSGEVFGKLIGVSRSAVSKYEKQTLKISKEQKETIAKIFGCKAELLDREVNRDEYLSLKNAATVYLRKQQIQQAKVLLEPEELEEPLTDGYYTIRRQLGMYPDMEEDILRLIEIYKQDPAVVHLILSGAESYLQIEKEDALCKDKSNYRKRQLCRDDGLVAIIAQAVTVALGKKK